MYRRQLIDYSQANPLIKVASVRTGKHNTRGPFQLPRGRTIPKPTDTKHRRQDKTSPSNLEHRLILPPYPPPFACTPTQTCIHTYMRMRPGHAHAPSNNHQHKSKKPYQPPITSFFSYNDLDSDESDLDERGPGPITRDNRAPSTTTTATTTPQHPQRLSLVPPVPGRVQADLLSVGMRVRKSVPEGYKTHKTATLPSIQTTLAIAGNGPTMTQTQYSVKPPQDPVPEDYQHQRELLPFSGLQKIGGYAEQPVTNVHLYGDNSAPSNRALNIFPLPAEAFSQPFSSQSSMDSSVSSSSLRPNPTNPYKRSWQDEDDKSNKLNTDFFFKIPVKVSEDEIPVSPLSATPPTAIHGFPHTALRTFAQPKSRRPGAGRAMDFDGMVVKNMDMDITLENADQEGRRNDFDDADFLRPWGPNTNEIEMDGV
ncbi:unnamed protein product [Periconia digitata]|uniref:Uncharacterized protein n=1 Tax=Periconia digitata TaxID=1303443 RepID=A0A9W4XSZ4_9PLEO|nr:unnamed protein product [Periconia digitata]